MSRRPAEAFQCWPLPRRASLSRKETRRICHRRLTGIIHSPRRWESHVCVARLRARAMRLTRACVARSGGQGGGGLHRRERCKMDSCCAYLTRLDSTLFQRPYLDALGCGVTLALKEAECVLRENARAADYDVFWVTSEVWATAVHHGVSLRKVTRVTVSRCVGVDRWGKQTGLSPSSLLFMSHVKTS